MTGQSRSGPKISPIHGCGHGADRGADPEAEPCTLMERHSVPSSLNRSRAWCLAIIPSETMAITEPIPIAWHDSLCVSLSA